MSELINITKYFGLLLTGVFIIWRFAGLKLYKKSDIHSLTNRLGKITTNLLILLFFGGWTYVVYHCFASIYYFPTFSTESDNFNIFLSHCLNYIGMTFTSWLIIFLLGFICFAIRKKEGGISLLKSNKVDRTFLLKPLKFMLILFPAVIPAAALFFFVYKYFSQSEWKLIAGALICIYYSYSFLEYITKKRRLWNKICGLVFREHYLLQRGWDITAIYKLRNITNTTELDKAITFFNQSISVYPTALSYLHLARTKAHYSHLIKASAPEKSKRLSKEVDYNMTQVKTKYPKEMLSGYYSENYNLRNGIPY